MNFFLKASRTSLIISITFNVASSVVAASSVGRTQSDFLRVSTNRRWLQVVNKTDCMEILTKSDTPPHGDGDKIMNSTEYVQFIDDLASTIIGISPSSEKLNYIQSVTEFTELPLEFIFLFNSMTCNYLCRITENEENCEAHCPHLGIPIDNAYDFGEDNVSISIVNYLQSVCDETMLELLEYLEFTNPPTTPPTTASTTAPTVSISPPLGLPIFAVIFGITTFGTALMAGLRRGKQYLQSENDEEDQAGLDLRSLPPSPDRELFPINVPTRDHFITLTT